MEGLLLLAVLGALLWAIVRWLSAPWRRYHEEHIAPLEMKIAAAQARRSEMESDLQEAIANAELFTRDFRAEVRQHQEAKTQAYEQLNPLRTKKSELHEEMDEVRSKLNSWHRNSKSMFGNKGRKIKDDSIFGWIGLEQTMAQKGQLENTRDSLSSEIGYLKGQMSAIYDGRIRPAKEGINAAFADQKRLELLKREGLDEQYFRKRARDLEGETSRIDAEVENLRVAIADATEAYKRQRRF